MKIICRTICVLIVLSLSVLCVGQANDTPPIDLNKLGTELQSVRDTILKAEEKSRGIEGGLIKALTEARLEILKTTEALLHQRVMAESTGAEFNVEVVVRQVDSEQSLALEQEIFAKMTEIEDARTEADKYTGGLVRSMKLATVATHEQSLAMLEQQYLIVKYGLPFSTSAPPASPRSGKSKSPESPDVAKASAKAGGSASKVLEPRVSKKRLTNLKYEKFLHFDIVWTAIGLEKPARAIKGVLVFADLFGEPKFRINITIDDPIEPGGVLTQEGVGFNFNQFRDTHKWLRSIDIEDTTTWFEPSSVIYQDGSRVDF